jgi:hypothetical protein
MGQLGSVRNAQADRSLRASPSHIVEECIVRTAEGGIKSRFMLAIGSPALSLLRLLPNLGFLSQALPVPCFRPTITRTTVVATTATSAMLAPQPTAGLDRSVMLATEPPSRWWNFETKLATLIAIPRPPPLPQDRPSMLFAESCLWRWHLLGPIAFAASRVAVANAPTAGLDWPAVNLAKPFLERRCSFSNSSFCNHTLSIT